MTAPQEQPKPEEKKEEVEEELPPLEPSEWLLPKKDKADPKDYGGDPFGGSNVPLPPEADGFW